MDPSWGLLVPCRPIGVARSAANFASPRRTHVSWKDVAGDHAVPSTDRNMLAQGIGRFTPVGQRAAEGPCDSGYPPLALRPTQGMYGHLSADQQVDERFHRKLLALEYGRSFESSATTTYDRGPGTNESPSPMRRAVRLEASIWRLRIRRRLANRSSQGTSDGAGEYGQLIGPINPMACRYVDRGLLSARLVPGDLSDILLQCIEQGHAATPTESLTLESHLREVDAIPLLSRRITGDASVGDIAVNHDQRSKL